MTDHRRQLVRPWLCVCGQRRRHSLLPAPVTTWPAGHLADGDTVPMGGYERWADLIGRRHLPAGLWCTCGTLLPCPTDLSARGRRIGGQW